MLPKLVLRPSGACLHPLSLYVLVTMRGPCLPRCPLSPILSSPYGTVHPFFSPISSPTSSLNAICLFATTEMYSPLRTLLSPAVLVGGCFLFHIPHPCTIAPPGSPMTFPDHSPFLLLKTFLICISCPQRVSPSMHPCCSHLLAPCVMPPHSLRNLVPGLLSLFPL